MKELYTESKRLTDEETTALIKLVQSGDISALETLYLHNINLIKMVAKRFSVSINARFDFEDLFQEAYIGFVNAAKNYNPSLNIKFSTIAVQCMTNSIMTFLKHNCSPLKITSTFTNQLRTLKGATLEMIKTGNLNPSINEISKSTGIEVNGILEIIRALDTGISLDTYEDFNYKNENVGLHEVVSNGEISINDLVEQKDLEENIKNVVKQAFLQNMHKYSNEELYLVFEFYRLTSINNKYPSNKTEHDITEYAKQLFIINNIDINEDKNILYSKYRKLYRNLREMAIVLKRYYNSSGERLSQGQLSEYLGVTQQVISKAEISGLEKVRKKIIEENIGL